MTLYVDASALLRLVLREPGPIVDLQQADTLVSSELLGVESLRTIDRLRVTGALTLDEASVRAASINEWLDAVNLVRLRPAVIARASLPLPWALGTLDALHLATALLWRERRDEPVRVATHDAAFGRAARAYGFQVSGVDPDAL